VLPEEPAVLLVRGEAGEAEQGQRLVARALGGQEIAVVPAAMPVDQLHPPPGEALEGVGLRRIDDVLDDAGDHDGRLASAGLPGNSDKANLGNKRSTGIVAANC